MELSLKHCIAGLVFAIFALPHIYAQGQDSVYIIKEGNKDPLKKLGKLFKKDTPIKFSITTDMKSLLKDRKAESTRHLAVLTTVDSKNENIDVPVMLQTRGNFRRSTDNCTFPPLWLIFDGKEKDKTVFKKQDKVKLVTHCSKEEYVQREYTVYKLFNIISEHSFLARPCEVTYIDSLQNRKTETKPAFLIEPEEDLAIRKGWKEIENVKISQSSVDSLTMATVAVFQYMIGNTDWSVPGQHNIKIYLQGKNKVYAVPYDFDHSGIVGTDYATPNPMLGIASVEERIYRGIHYPPGFLNKIFKNFEAAKEEIYKLYTDNAAFDERYRKFVIGYLDKFFEEIKDRASICSTFDKTAMMSLKKQ